MTNLERPEIEPMLEPAPSALTIKDDVIGEGDAATAGAVVNVHYLGVDYESGEEFDSSWSRNQSIEFPLGRLIKGWQEGIPGMKVGGRRTLICPPEYAYGPAGSGHHLSGRTLVFVIDLLGVK
jgi:peptidylprolyl isomerase